MGQALPVVAQTVGRCRRWGFGGWGGGLGVTTFLVPVAGVFGEPEGLNPSAPTPVCTDAYMLPILLDFALMRFALSGAGKKMRLFFLCGLDFLRQPTRFANFGSLVEFSFVVRGNIVGPPLERPRAARKLPTKGASEVAAQNCVLG